MDAGMRAAILDPRHDGRTVEAVPANRQHRSPSNVATAQVIAIAIAFMDKGLVRIVTRCGSGRRVTWPQRYGL